MLRQWTIYDGGSQNHYTSEELFAYLYHLRGCRTGTVINDRAAQTIASWWHSPGHPYSTVLSTMGRVDRYMSLSDFGDPDKAETPDDADALRALGAYIEHHITTAESGSRPCACRDCMDTVVGVVGDVCHACEEEGCDPTDTRAECERPGAYDDAGYDPETDCTDPECPGCLYCIPGA